MIDEHYINPRLAAVYDISSGWSEDRQFYLELADETPIDILDFGCGTGLIANAYAAKGHRVTGADPAPAMLDVARKSTLGSKIEWVEATAQNFQSEKQFDLIIMTGHAFQVLTEPLDVATALANVATLLKSNGRFVFETRNRAIDWVTRWTHNKRLDTPYGVLDIRRIVTRHTDERIWFETHYQFTDGSFVSPSELRFWTDSEVRALAGAAGLDIQHFYGDWHRNPFNAETSEEQIYVLGRSGKRVPI